MSNSTFHFIHHNAAAWQLFCTMGRAENVAQELTDKFNELASEAHMKMSAGTPRDPVVEEMLTKMQAFMQERAQYGACDLGAQDALSRAMHQVFGTPVIRH